jgi:CheY-like chemotaxis protein
VSRPIRVLLVEDNPGDADLTCETLENSKLSVDIAVLADGSEALAYLQRQSAIGPAGLPDLILLDLNLPKLDGTQVIAEIKRHAELRRIPIVILTSSDAEQDVIRSYELGASCYVTKPVGLEAFQTIVRSVEQFWFRIVRLP